MSEKLNCETCGEALEDDERVVQVRVGHLEDGEFVPEEDICYQHRRCYDKELTTVYG